MHIKSAEFLVSNSNVAKCPKNKMPEYAFIGRSNVGKSSLINMLTDRKNLAKTSGRPGKTQLINHFVINQTWYLVDLPGYGYARVSKKVKKEFQKFITQYFEEREQLVSAFVLIDCRHEPQPIDREFMQYLGEKQIPFSIIFTKADKLKPKALERNIENYKQELLAGAWAEMPNYFISSATNSTGKDEILDYIDAINAQLKES
ncbi:MULTISPECIES: ribosome biogenesis GTP-binding protein YihA/YsxC [Leeuwenhoekiella]|jgi:GTP-binding protein|uniref:Probable GTP-binding protein EngB n=1 Tax=Leeuwenhoekiella blandensis (strain CECT 7118 / CCUG 51940 / KCTC 22103 / MED217) TaxID=398720 RepID=A3XI70_LEEBM|nr:MULTISPECIES: ribosome biogenesis GTP-binding protein YihA/YsxC [Leeuwenhoekiella]EAQ51024.1 GTP-binding protein [Leeuwenhoekiella blandensis MED217]MAO42726.1 YihA family ribosome biogenesis GTP-binding protein [Leeuwenhoekiella sp.]HBT08808.1 YihA family ribosome biogenesis GTP-binding protein [Leeuwenhoekiella sp.]HCW64079.1 YihA family ribosome biogenesis GTP-binding protein [Leeuwenhoekiella sp.]|tara:strand:+ start:1273 stop:1881 length:609 start_codon:yes stop_codon:yes gene_type:complete